MVINKDLKEQREIIKVATRDVKQLQKKFKGRQREIAENRRAAIQCNIRKIEAANREKIRKQQECTSAIVMHGLWQTEGEVENMLRSYKTKTSKIDALKAQIKFRRDVLKQKAEDKKSFSFSKKVAQQRAQLSVDELRQNLITLVKQCIVKPSDEEIHILVGKRVRHRFMKDGVVKWYTGRVISQVTKDPSQYIKGPREYLAIWCH